MTVRTKGVDGDGPFLPDEILAQGDVVRRVAEIEPQIAEVAEEVYRRGVRDVVMTGCGDSLFAAMAARHAFSGFSRWLTHAMHALEYARDFYRTSDRDTLVCALSYGGETRRTLEAAIGARYRGAQVLAISVDKRGPIPQLADHFLPNVAPLERSNCRTGSFQAAYLELYLLAAHLAAQRGELDDAQLALVRGDLAELETVLHDFASEIRGRATEVAHMIRTAGHVHYLGGGEAHAATLYGAAKLDETSSIPTLPQDTEQFAHEAIFSLEPDSLVIVTALSGPFYERAVQVADAVRTIGAPTIGIGDDGAFASHVDQFIETPRLASGRFGMSIAVVPMQWMALADALARGSDPDRVRHKNVNSPLIREIPIWSEDDYRRHDPQGELLRG
ncbi:MAG: SIS domain-containing protein [Candidatus Limnocylindria bacterium]